MTKEKVYSPAQTGTGTFIGGPAASVFFIAKNYSSLRDEAHFKKTILIGSISCFVLLLVIPFLPESFPKMAFPFANIYLAQHIVSIYQFKKQSIIDSEAFTFHSNWRVFLVSLLFLLLSCVVIVAYIFVLIVGFGIHLK